MRAVLYVLTTLSVIGLAFWAYRENYATQQALSDTDELRQEIRQAHSRLAVLRAEWAYLNRPERLRDLVDLNFRDLLLVPLSSDHFGETENIAYPRQREIQVMDPIDVQGVLEEPAQ